MTDYEYQKTIIVSAILGAIFTIIVFQMLKPSPQNPPVAPKSNFAVVDTYKDCDIVQWSDNQMATYKYFLDCNNK